MEIHTVAVIGNGMMGNTIAQVFAGNPKLRVQLWGLPLGETPKAPIAQNLELMLARDVITKEDAMAILARIDPVADLAEAVREADFIIECVPEKMELKQSIFAEIEQSCRPDAILATNTSVMSPTEIFAHCQHRARVVGTHFWNPGHLIPLVEVVKSAYTAESTIEDTMQLLSDCGKRPIFCKKDVPGFVANRLQHALWREAFYMVQEGIADAKTVDDACKYGPGLRWPILGPMENSDMVGIDLSQQIHEYILPHLADNHTPSPCLKDMLEKGDNGFKSGQGWQAWTADEMDNSRQRLQEYLIDQAANTKP